MVTFGSRSGVEPEDRVLLGRPAVQPGRGAPFPDADPGGLLRQAELRLAFGQVLGAGGDPLLERRIGLPQRPLPAPTAPARPTSRAQAGSPTASSPAIACRQVARTADSGRAAAA